MNQEFRENISWSAVTRFGTILLACVLLALKGGQSLTPYVASLCQLFGLSGLAFYFCLELVADQRDRRRTRVACRSVERRLSHRLRAESNVAAIHAHTLDDDDVTGDVESAMDSKVDLSVYLGPVTQPTLSV